MRFAYSTINWGANCDISQVANEIHTAGWTAVELFGHSLDWLGTPSRLATDLNGLEVATFFASINLPVSEQDLSIHKRRIEYAAEVGAESYGLVGGSRPRWGPPARADVRELSGACEELAEFAAACNVSVSYHPHTACTVETSDELDLLLEGTEALQLCLDASHIAVVGEDPESVMRRYWDRMAYVHLKDWGYGKFVELGAGTVGIDFPAILSLLDNQDFPGWVVVEQSRSDVSPWESLVSNARYVTDLGYSIDHRR